jgi:hypothetical protein
MYLAERVRNHVRWPGYDRIVNDIENRMEG